jgi:hypothetical protein
MDDFNLKKFLVENKVTSNSKIFEAFEEKAPESITVKLTDEGKKRFGLTTTPGAVKMNPGVYYNFGNTKYDPEKPQEAEILLAIYSPDIKEIRTSTIRPSKQFGELTKTQELRPHIIRDLKLQLVPMSNSKFPNGFETGMKDDRGYFEIV